MKLLDAPDVLAKAPRTFGAFDDFLEFVSGDLFTDTSADTGAAVANIDGAGGQVTLTTGATDNNECYLLTSKELFKFADDKPLVFETRLKYSEANTDDANVCMGLMDAVGANAILDNGGGPKASYSGAVFFKVDGGTRWNVEVSDSGTQTTVELTAANSLNKTAQTAGGTSFATFRIEFAPYTSTKAEIRFFIDDTLVYKVSEYTFANATEMNAFVGVKAGDSNSEVVTVDYVSAFQLR